MQGHQFQRHQCRDINSRDINSGKQIQKQNPEYKSGGQIPNTNPTQNGSPLTPLDRLRELPAVLFGILVFAVGFEQKIDGMDQVDQILFRQTFLQLQQIRNRIGA